MASQMGTRRLFTAWEWLGAILGELVELVTDKEVKDTLETKIKKM